jgi:hypothetical protein
MADYGIYKVRCPFFRERDNSHPRIIKCEGLEKNNSLHLVFKHNREPHFSKFCCSEYEKCPISNMLFSKY